MNLRALSVLSLVVLGGALSADPSRAATQAGQEGLVAVQSRSFDELYLSSGADFTSYRKVMIDPVRVEFHRDWPSYRYAREVTHPVPEASIRRIAENTAMDAQASLTEAFRAHGYEIAAAPGPAVLRLTPSVVDLYVYAPDRLSPWPSKTFTRDAGEALLVLDARDAVSGALLGRAVQRGTAQQLGRFARANDVSNRFWFEALFRRWAAACVALFRPAESKP